MRGCGHNGRGSSRMGQGQCRCYAVLYRPTGTTPTASPSDLLAGPATQGGMMAVSNPGTWHRGSLSCMYGVMLRLCRPHHTGVASACRRSITKQQCSVWACVGRVGQDRLLMGCVSGRSSPLCIRMTERTLWNVCTSVGSWQGSTRWCAQRSCRVVPHRVTSCAAYLGTALPSGAEGDM